LGKGIGHKDSEVWPACWAGMASIAMAVLRLVKSKHPH